MPKKVVAKKKVSAKKEIKKEELKPVEKIKKVEEVNIVQEEEAYQPMVADSFPDTEALRPVEDTPEQVLPVSSVNPIVEDASRMKPRSSRWLKISLIVLAVLLIGGIPSYYFYNQYQNAYKNYQEVLKSAPSVKKNDLKDIVERVGKLIELPKGDTVTLATVTDVSKLGTNPFFKNAENGDKILIFRESNKAIIYRPSLNKLIDVGQINVTTNVSASASLTPTVTQITKIAIYNGTTINGLAASVEKNLMGKGAPVKVLSKESAQENTYTETIVIDLTGKNSNAVTSLAAMVGGKVASLPASEVKPTGAEILIIVGSSYKAQ